MNSRAVILIGLFACAALAWVGLRHIPQPGFQGVANVTIQKTPSNAQPLSPHRMVENGEVARTKTSALSETVKPASHEKDLLFDEHIARFKNLKDLRSFVALARTHGFQVLDVSDRLNAVRVRVNDDEKWDRFLSDHPVPPEVSNNYVIRLPELPDSYTQARGPLDLKSDYVAFEDHSLAWLGIKDNANWGAGVTVAILDTGLEDQVRAGRSITQIDMLPDSPSVNGSFDGHATAVASILAGGDPETPGVAPASDLLSIRVLSSDGTGDSFTLARGIVEATDRGAKIISMSLGSYGNSPILKEAVQYAQQRGLILVAAVGNDGFGEITYPARYAGVVAVTAVDARGSHLEFANTGKEISIAAPGFGIDAAWTGNEIVSFSGTSGAVPFVAGAIASLLSQNQGMTGRAAADILSKYSDDSGFPGRDSLFGYGILDMTRVTNRDLHGIHDAAVASQYLQNSLLNGGTMSIGTAIQNRGTEPLSSVRLNIAVNGIPQASYFLKIDVGQTVSQALSLSHAQFGGAKTLTVTSSVTLNGVTESNLQNNTLSSAVYLFPLPQSAP